MINKNKQEGQFMKAIQVIEYGGPETLQLRELPTPEPGPGQALVQIAAAGVNFMDIGVRTGMYLHGELPFTLGVEGSGRILALGEGVQELHVGDRVA
jgi:NADPH:quinone reductase